MTIDLSALANTLLLGLLSVVATVFSAWIAKHIKDQSTAATLAVAVQNSIGALQQAATSELQAHRLQVSIPGVPALLTPAVQYVLDHAGEEAARHGITPDQIAAKVEAQIGLAQVQSDIRAPAVTPLAPGTAT